MLDSSKPATLSAGMGAFVAVATASLLILIGTVLCVIRHRRKARLAGLDMAEVNQRSVFKSIFVVRLRLGRSFFHFALWDFLEEETRCSFLRKLALANERGDHFLAAMFTVYRVAFESALKSYQIGLLFTHKNGDFGGIFLTERSCAALISKVECHISDRLCATVWCSVNRYSDRRGSE